MKNLIIVMGLATMLAWPRCLADTVAVSVNTIPLQGISGDFVIDFFGGSPLENNLVTVTDFATDSVLSAATMSGSVTGSLVPGPLTLSDVDFFNEWSQAVTFGTSISFDLSISTNSTPGGIPDSLSVFLLNASRNPFATSDPTGADSLFTIEINSQSPGASVFSSSFETTTVSQIQAVPEPFGGFLAGFTLLAVLLGRRCALRDQNNRNLNSPLGL
jgi:hypothetical protein